MFSLMLSLSIVNDYLVLLDNSTAFAKVGFYLEQQKTALMVDESFLQKLEQHKPKGLHHMQRQNRKDGICWCLVN